MRLKHLSVANGQRWLAACFAAAASLVAMALPATSAAQPLTLRDDRGATHHLPAPPTRIVSLLPSLTETVWVLGGGARLVGVDRYSNWPAAVAALPRLGGIDDAPIEAIVALKPDVVLASTSARSLDRLEALGLRVLRLKSDSHADLRRTLDTVAQLLGTPQEGARLWAQVERDLQAAATRVPPALRGQSVYFEIGTGPYAAGRQSFIGETLHALGMRNVVPAELGPFPLLNPEFVVRAAPQIVMGEARAVAAMRDRPGWSSMPAIRSGWRCGFDAQGYELLTRPGPRLGEAAARLADCLAGLETLR